MAVYMKYGSTIKGPTTTEGWKDWITCSSIQMGAGRGVDSSKGKGQNRAGSEPSISEITITKEWDEKSSSKLFEESVAGKMDNLVEIHFTTVSGQTQAAFMIVKLKDTCISGYSMSSGGEGKPSESISLNFSHIELIPKIQDEALGETDGDKVSYNLTLMKANA